MTTFYGKNSIEFREIFQKEAALSENKFRSKVENFTLPFRCKLGFHKWGSKGWLNAPTAYDPCVRETVYLAKSQYSVSSPVPIQTCKCCGKLSIRTDVIVIPSQERPNPFSNKNFDCVCGKGNSLHRQEFDNQKKQLLDIVRGIKGTPNNKNLGRNEPNQSSTRDRWGKNWNRKIN